MSHFLQLFGQNLTKTPKHGSLLEKLLNLAKSMIFFLLFHQMSHFLIFFPENMIKTPKHGSLLEKCPVLAKSMISRAFSRNEPLFATNWSKPDQNTETW